MKCFRFKWYRDNSDWSIQERPGFPFLISPASDCPVISICIERNYRKEPENIRRRHQCKGNRIIVMAGIILNGRIDQHVFCSSTMNADINRYEVHDPHF
ncbi:hypothetical protein AVEN_92193-1 [Araneus ventricosus]|uniref:Uncharacterized protein n=1 Tax=Araneus ventricosus TaxID=182803 RepID=A0A4Y2AKT0_ARAVE|nr:hypothetical protein AVEN_92193-1 [Araneus ventricosus]